MDNQNGLDLNQLATSEDQQATMAVINPLDNQPLLGDDGEPLEIVLAGPDSKQYKESNRAAQNRRLKALSRGKKLSITAEELEAQGLSSLVACTLSWKGIVFDGEELDCTPKNAREIYKKLPWLREQAEEFVDDRSNFLGN